ncbi:acyltransferase family protein [Hymenobacter chitinivorans]|uniref:Peptidoglycan/LPS O-acetylase OafA/YrhL n=1 Tax=Hymenobacter chitinivorans DSM 11115 TaxID=1121954 RepID=A0A2M9BLD7_9BACT|nr:acyltransferase [Hymenobacter chitinivorans]PJJ58735.1 peptidoglycan/LPS O-acetylase OafA/YrhL [Hymenobacter chitinivorans DSM 11115]
MTEIPLPAQPIKLAYIDALRGWAILAVVWVHVLYFGAQEQFLRSDFVSFCLSGARGVQLFFVVSAFTLFLSMGVRQRKEKYPTLNFFIRRFFRIAPLFYLGILFYVLTYSYSWASLRSVLVTVLFINGAHPYTINSLVPGGWSITVEMTFYAVAPLLFRWIKSLRSAVWLCGISLGASMVLSYLLRQHPVISIHDEASKLVYDDWLFGYFPNQLPVFSLGIVFYYVVKENKPLPRPGTLLACSLGLLAVLIVLMSFFGDAHRSQWLLLGHSLPAPAHWLFSVAFLLLALALHQREYSFFVNPLTTYIGKISFSLYLAHFAVFTFLNKLGVFSLIPATGPSSSMANLLIRFATGLLVSAGVAHLLFRFIETPFQQLGKRLIAQLEHRENLARPLVCQ